MRIARKARAALTKSPTADAHSDSETGPFADLANANREIARLRSELAAKDVSAAVSAAHLALDAEDSCIPVQVRSCVLHSCVAQLRPSGQLRTCQGYALPLTQLSAHLLNCEAPASAEGPAAPTALGLARTKLPLPNADEASLDAARCWDRLSPRRCHSWSVPLIRARHAGLGRHRSRIPGPTPSYTTRYPTFALHCTLQLPALSSLTDPPSLPCGRRPTLAHASESKLDALADAGEVLHEVKTTVLLEVKTTLAADLERVEREAQSKRSDARAEAAGGQLVRRR